MSRTIDAISSRVPGVKELLAFSLKSSSVPYVGYVRFWSIGTHPNWEYRNWEGRMVSRSVRSVREQTDRVRVSFDGVLREFGDSGMNV